MNISKSFKDYSGLFCASLFLAYSFYLGKGQEKPFIFISKQEKSFNLDNKFLVNFNLGLKSFISSSLWVSTILESDHDHYKNKDLNSWMFLRFNTISVIDPSFYENYAFGGTYLSIIKDDLPGASAIYQKGLKIFPNDFSLIKDASFHFYFEAKDLGTAKDLFRKLKTFPNIPFYLIGPLTRLEASQGNLDDAFIMLSDLQNKFSSETAIGKTIFNYRYSIKSEKDLNCLNHHPKDECPETMDLEGRPYLFENGKFTAQRKWLPYRLK